MYKFKETTCCFEQVTRRIVDLITASETKTRL